MSTEEPTSAPAAESPAPAASAEATPAAEDAPASTKDNKPKSKKAAPKKAAPTSSKPSGGAKKGGAASADNKNFEVGDIVLARLKGFPPWPARIADPETVPSKVSAQRPSKSSHIFCVNYFPAGDFSWLHSKEITHLSESDIKSYLSAGHRKASGGLKEAYETAQDPTDWLKTQQAELKRREEEEREAEEGVDELEDEDAGSGGKRKRSAAKPAPKKKAKSATKIASEDEAPAATKSKAKNNKKAAPVSVADKDAPADDDPLSSDPECVKVKDWRHKLQRAFLGKALPTAPEMDSYNEIFNTIEGYKSITIEALQYSKIGKVMKKIATLEGIPRNDEFKITDRASKLMNDWHDFINSSGGDKTNGDAPKSEGKPKSKAEAPAATEEKKEETNGTTAAEEPATNGETETAAEEKGQEAEEAKEAKEDEAKEDGKMDVDA